MYERSNHIDDFFIAGFKYYDGADVLAELKPGMVLDLAPEFDNPHDSDAVTIRFRGLKLGFIPRDCNGLAAQLLYFGHADVLGCKVIQVSPEKDPSQQVRVKLFMTDHRPQA